MKYLLSIILCGAFTILHAQIDWSNYSTSFEGADDVDSIPLLVTAIPYNGISNNFDDIDALEGIDKANHLLANLNSNSRQFYVYDSGAVHFFAPGIFKNNAGNYEFCVLLNGKQFIKSWSNINTFTNTSLNSFRPNFAYLGGYKTTWNNFILVELRNKKTSKIVSTSLVFWKTEKPTLLNVYSTEQLPEALKKIDNIYFDSTDQQQLKQFKQDYPENEIDSGTGFPKKFIFHANENNLFFFFNAIAFKKSAIEYSLLKDGNTIINWKQNDFDNHYIWLKNLEHGNYVLKVRYTRQRQSVSSFDFEIEPLFQQTILFKIISAVLIIAFIGFVIAMIRLQQQKKLSQKHKKEKIDLELKSIRSQLNPHFIFNSFASIQGLINKNEIGNANKYLSDFSNMMRNTLDGSQKEFNTLSKEIALLNNYLQLEQLRFKFKYTINSNLNNNEIEIPSLILQPIVENAVKHGIASLQENGRIEISFKRNNDDLLIDITDNGKGFNANAKQTGYGLKLTKERIQLINETFDHQSIIFNINTTTGTAVHLIFKNWLA